MIPFLPPNAPFPPVERALKRPDGLLAAGLDLSIETLARAYTRGIFPWFSTPAIRFSGGRRTREWCCPATSSTCPVRSAAG